MVTAGDACGGSEALVVAEKRRCRGAKPLAGGLRRIKSVFSSIAKRLHLAPRRQRLAEVEATPAATPQRRHVARQILGRTPTKLYSPFGIETPRFAADLDDRAEPYTPVHAYVHLGAYGFTCVY